MEKKLTKRKTRPKEIPQWMECTWRRKPCQRDDCPICGKIKKDQAKQLIKGENPNDIAVILADVGQNLKEVLLMIQQDARKKGFEITNLKNIKEPPLPENFPLYQEVSGWQKSVFSLIENPKAGFWAYTEDAQDLFWYANTLSAKVYRQLCNRWEIEQGADYGKFDYQYTSYVINECLKTIEASLGRLIAVGSIDKGKLIFIAAQMLLFKKKIISV